MTPVGPGVGDAAPAFSARSQHGGTITLEDLRGTPAVLVFFPWAFSGICTRELASFRADAARYTELGARVVGLSCDPMFTLRVFAEAEDLPFELLSDHWPHGAIARAYGVFDEGAGVARRGTFLLDGAGTIVWTVRQGIDVRRDAAAPLAALTALVSPVA